MHVDGIYCEVQLTGPLVLVKNLDVPGVVAHIGTIFASNNINIANFSLGRRDSGEPHGSDGGGDDRYAGAAERAG